MFMTRMLTRDLFAVANFFVGPLMPCMVDSGLIIFIHHQSGRKKEEKNNNNLTKLNYYNIHSTISSRN